MDGADLMHLTEKQRRAAQEPERDVLLTAGAGSGKTRTLVARYLWLLEEGFDPREIVAITFTEKAAREMRNRVREGVRRRTLRADSSERDRWEALQARMDAARIGTIHSFCAEVLRAHPARAGRDPAFEVLEEGTVRAIKAQTVEDVLAEAAEDAETVEIFSDLSTQGLRRVLSRLLTERIDLREHLAAERDHVGQRRSALAAAITAFLDDAQVTAAIGEMRALLEKGELEADAGGTLAPRIEELLTVWDGLEKLRQGEAWLELAAALFSARREQIKRGSGKRGSQAKAALAELQFAYDTQVDPWLGGKNSSDEAPDLTLEARLPEVLARLRKVAEQAAEAYESVLESRTVVDFDDLEAEAARLLADPAVRARWRSSIAHVLVDEFQDTNARQRSIVEALAPVGEGGLFVVGDARQSIYRFRGADVTVFRELASRIESAGGLVVNLDETFRPHAGLLQAVDGIVAPVMEKEAQAAAYKVPYRSLSAVRKAPETAAPSPFLELVLAAGNSAEEARPRAAKALAVRLLELWRQDRFAGWGQVALLFRASTAFSTYEDALEEAGIPYVTVAGRGFYERPEVRDLLNAVRALADPTDDQALAGFLRSPVIGLKDASVAALRVGSNERRSFAAALEHHLDVLPPDERTKAEKARSVLDELGEMADRIPVAELLKRLMDRLDYRAMLASAESRLWRNVDKLLQDALSSELVRVHSFLEYLSTLRDVGAREGEALSDAEGSVQLMTIHKAKGLEFDLVVLADAGRRPAGWGEPVYLRSETGLAVRLDRVDADPISYQIAKARDRAESDAEEERLLYVAATRAREHLLVSGHLTPTKSGWRTDGMLDWILNAAELNLDELSPGTIVENFRLPVGGIARVWFAPPEPTIEPERIPAPDWPVGSETPLVRRLQQVPAERTDPKIDEEPDRSWRATAVRAYAPAAAVGRILHAAVARRVKSGEPEARSLLEAAALQEGLIDPKQRHKAVEEADIYLKRLQDHPLWLELMRADHAFHELPYTWQAPDGTPESGKIDLLYQVDGIWQLLDFKTDEVRPGTEIAQDVHDRYSAQLKRYRKAASALLGQPVMAKLVFLNYHEGVQVESVR